MIAISMKCFVLDIILCTGVCPMLQDPTNGKVVLQGDTAFFVCLSGTTVMGNPILLCVNGDWNNPPPTCKFLNP